MSKKLKKKLEMNKSISLILNMILVLFGLIGFIKNVELLGKVELKYYTQDCNLFAIIVELVYLYFAISEKKIPRWLQLLKYVAVLSLTITFIVVLFILVPMYNFDFKLLLYTGPCLYHHVLCPILALVSFIFFEDYVYKKKDIVTAMSFTFIYAAVTILLNVLGFLIGPYPFLEVMKNPWYESIMWTIIVIGGAMLISYLIYYLNEKYTEHEKNVWR